MSQNFITSPSEYRGVDAKLREIFYPERRLPEQVFRGQVGSCAFLEFDVMLSRAFAATLASFAAKGGDTDVYVTVPDPDPEGYYFSHFQRYGAFRVKTSKLESDYFAALRAEPEGSPADALLYVANVVTLFGDTKSWAIWGERDLGIGVAAIQNKRLGEIGPWAAAHGIKWFDIENAISDLVALNFPGQVTPSNIAADLRAHYGSCR